MASIPFTQPVRPRLPVVLYPVVAAAAVYLAYRSALEPESILRLTVTAVALVVFLARADLALLLLVAIAPLEGLFAQTSTFTTPAKMAGVLAFGSFGLHAVISRRKLVFDRSHVLVLLILALAMISTVVARDAPSAMVTTLRYGSFVALYMVVSQWVGDHVLQRRLVWVLSLASAVAGLLAVQDFLTGEYTYRASLPHGDPNDLAFILATTLPLTLWLLGSRPLVRPLVIAMIGVISLAIVLTYSRGALLGLSVAAVWLIATERRRIPLLVAGAIASALAAIVFVQASPESTFRLEQGLFAKQKVAAENVDTRLTAWTTAIELTADHPLLGIGPGNFRTYFPEAAGIPAGVETAGVVHNAYLDVAVELGVVGLALFLLYLVLVFQRLSGAMRSRAGPPGLASAARTAFIVGVVSALTLSEQYYAPFWLLGGLATALWLEGRRAESRGSFRQPAAATSPAGLDPV